MGQATARERLIRQLRMAHAGERAAADAYAGHWRSVRAPDERETIARIEQEERAHRVRVGAMLVELGAGPAPLRELIFAVVGRILGALCHVTGWFCPMYGAGWIEGRNVQEYVDAAVFARSADRPDLAEELLGMAEVEWDHEAWFRAKAAGHWLARAVPLWRASPPRAALRAGSATPGLPAA